MKRNICAFHEQHSAVTHSVRRPADCEAEAQCNASDLNPTRHATLVRYSRSKSKTHSTCCVSSSWPDCGTRLDAKSSTDAFDQSLVLQFPWRGIHEAPQQIENRILTWRWRLTVENE